MKRLLYIVFALLMISALSLSAIAAEGDLVYDEAELLTPAEESELYEALSEIGNTLGVEVAVATVETNRGMDVDTFVEYFYDTYDYGMGAKKDGVLLLVSMEERDWRILSNGIGADAVSPADIENIGSSVASYLSEGQYAEAFAEFAAECRYEIDGEINGFPFDFTRSLIISLVIGIVASLIITGIMRGQLKTVRSRADADEYTRAGSMRITHSADIYLYRTVSRRKRETKSSSSSGSRNVGGGKF